MYKISVLLPSAHPDKRSAFLANLEKMSKNFQTLEICVCLDGDKENWQYENIKYTYHEPTEYRSMFFNAAYRISTAPWILLANDDIEIQTKHWDAMFDFSDPWRLYHFDDGQFRNTFGCHPLTSRKVFEMMDAKGLIYPNFKSMGCDTMIWDVMPPIKRIYMPDIKIKHDRVLDAKKIAEMEEDYKYYDTFRETRETVFKQISVECNLEPVKVLVGLSTGEFIRKANFLPSFLGLEKPVGTLMTTVHGQSPAKARNIIIEQALANDCTHILFLDDDMEFPPDTLMKLLKHDVDGVMGLYLMRTYPHFPVAFDKAFPNGFNKFLYMTPDVQGLVPLTNGGLGCFLVKANVFRKMKAPWITLGEIEKDGWCDDVSFFNRYREAGFKLYLDTEVQIGHMTTLTIFPMFADGRWLSNYKHPNGNVIVPQVIPTDEDTKKEIEKHENTPLPVG